MEMFSLSIVVEENLTRLDSLIIDHTILASNLQAELRRLQDLLAEIRDALRTKSSISYWLMELQEVVHKAEDVIDELAYEILRPKVTLSNFLKKLVFNVRLAYKVRFLIGSLNKIKNEAKALRVQDNRMIPHIDLDRETDSVLEIPVIGREDDISKIINLLTRSSDQRVLTVVSIVGMDGLGKTSLAKLVCQRVMALKLFRVKKRVCVSEKCDGQNILGQILQCLNASMGGLTNIDEKETSERERFLLVLDDVCEDVGTWWDDLRTRLLEICTHIETVVLVTTCSEQVASIVETSYQHRHTLGFLSDDDCWFILKERAFRNTRHELLLSNFEAIGREIAKICRGVPLAAKVLGGTLRFNMDEGAWLETIDRHIQEARNNEENFERILLLCVSYLPSTLKKWFPICSVFPKGFLIIKEDLIQLWMGQKFDGSYDLCNLYFNTLLANSFFQDAEIDDDGDVIKCKMHNLVHNLALSLQKSEMSSHCSNDSEALPKNKVKYLSSIILNSSPFQMSWNPKSLRTLYLNDVDTENFPSSVSKLKHFRFLHVSNTKVRPLPKSVTDIFTLQILTLSNCSCVQLPLLGDLPFLKVLKLSHMQGVKCIGKEPHEGNNRRYEVRVFRSLKSLSLSWMENLTEWIPPLHGSKVVIFPLLESLSIQCCPKLTSFPMRDLPALVKIKIDDCEELRFIFHEHKSFPSVTSLSVARCPKLTYLRNWLLSNKSYKEFKVRKCEWLKLIPNDLGMQSSLIFLQIYCCKELGFFPEEILCRLTCLRKLSIGAFSEKLDDFCYLNRIKDLSHLEELEIWGSDVFNRKMSALPNQLQHHARLQSLKVKGFTTMEALPEWFPNLRSLKTISLYNCWHLEYQSTSAIIQRFPNLRHVYFSGCPALENM